MRERSQYYFFLLFVTFCIPAASQNTDTLKDRRHSVGIVICPIAFSSWRFSGYRIDPEEQDGSRFESRNHPVKFWPSGLRYTYHLTPRLGLETGINYCSERTNVHMAHYNENSTERIKYIDYREDFIQIPISWIFFPYSKIDFKNANNPLFASLGFSFDFIISDRTISYSGNNIDQRRNPPPGGWDFNGKIETAGNNKNKFRFNRISPLCSLGQQINRKGKFSFYYTFAVVQVKAIYEMKNTVEFFKNTRVGLFCTGMDYNF